MEDFEEGSALHAAILSGSSAADVDARARSRAQFASIVDRYARGSTAAAAVVAHCPGDAMLDEVNRYLDRLYRSPQQRDFHQAFLASCLRIIYGDAYKRERHRVMVKYGFESKKQQVLVCAPRRMGKTFATAFFCIAMAIVKSGIELSIFSPGKRQSVALMGHIFDFMRRLGETDRIIRKNEEKLVLRAADGGESKINAFPSAVRTLKGVSGTVVILEEMAQIPPEVLFEVVVPLHQLDVTCVIGISTITDENNFMTRYLSKKDKNGEPLFAVKRIYLACEPCRAADRAAACNHNSHLLPDWSSARKRKIINCIMEGQEELLSREIGGVASSLHSKAFLPRAVTALAERPRESISDRRDYPRVFVAIDPNGAGKDSDFAMLTLLRHEGLFIVIGLESFTSRSAMENHALVVRHVRALETHPKFAGALKVFIIESNLGLESEHLATMLKDNVSNYLVMNEREDARTGFQTTNTMKTLAVEAIRERLADGALRIAEESDMVCVSDSYATSVGVLLEQMRSFSEVLRESDVRKPKKFYSGKGAGKDDLVIALLLGVLWSGFFFRTPRYANLA